MARTGDQAFPALPVHVFPPDVPFGQWPAKLTVALERLAQSAYTWDDANPAVCWDDPNPDRYVWDSAKIGSGYIDTVCDLIALTIDPGTPDENGLFPPYEVVLSLTNPGGKYTAWSSDGRLAYWAPGRRLKIWATLPDGSKWWLFSGRVSTFIPDFRSGTMTVIAYDGLGTLADGFGRNWTPGTPAQRARARIQSIADQAAFTDVVTGDVGDNPLTTSMQDRAVSPLEAMQTAAMSDGGVVFADVDSRVFYRDRLWRSGRADQATIPAFTDNICDHIGLEVVWDPVMASDDEGLFTTVELENEAGLFATATLAAGDPDAWYSGTTYRLTHPGPDLWTTQGDGDQLAQFLLDRQSTPSMRIAEFGLWLHDPRRDLWRTAIDLRRGDWLNWISDFVDAEGRPGRLQVVCVVAGVRHEITADQWVATVSTSRSTEPFAMTLWDQSPYLWDDTDSGNVWRF